MVARVLWGHVRPLIPYLELVKMSVGLAPFSWGLEHVAVNRKAKSCAPPQQKELINGSLLDSRR